MPDALVVHPFWPGSVITLMSHFFNWAIGDSGLFSRFPEHRYWSFPNAPEMLFALCPFSLWIGPLEFVFIVVCFTMIDFAVDISFRDEYRHRRLLLKFERSLSFYFAAHFLGNLYVMVLECGRLYGHMKRKDIFKGIFRRFDWHCGRLVNARRNFRKREAWKFSLFVLFLLFKFVLQNLFIGTTTCPTPWSGSIIAV